jgi:hypothetical protein
LWSWLFPLNNDAILSVEDIAKLLRMLEQDIAVTKHAMGVVAALVVVILGLGHFGNLPASRDIYAHFLALHQYQASIVYL